MFWQRPYLVGRTVTRYRMPGAAGAVLLASLIWMISASRTHSTPRQPNAEASAAVYLGTVRTTLRVASEHHGHLQLVVHLDLRGRSITNQRVSLTLQPLPPLIAEPEGYRLHAQGGSYAVAVAMTAAGAWHVQVRASPTSRGAGIGTAHFLLRASPNPRLVPSTVSPLLSPRGGSGEVTLPLGDGKAVLQVAPGVFARENTFTVRLERKHVPLPPSVQLTLTMEEMDMGVTHLVAAAVHPGVYVTHGSFAMGGTWRVKLAVGGRQAYALMPVGR